MFPNAKNRRHWSFPDPSQAQGSEEEQLKVYRQVRDAIEQKIEAGGLAGTSLFKFGLELNQPFVSSLSSISGQSIHTGRIGIL